MRKLAIVPAVLLLAGLAACSKPKPRVVLRGSTPNSSLQKDNRELYVYCPGCGRQLDAAAEARCPDQKNCDTEFFWDNDYPCGFCNGLGTCPVCRIYEQKAGKCWNCSGAGVLIYLGTYRPCPDCKGKKVCIACGGKKECDYCSGKGKLDASLVKQKARKPSAGDAEAEKGESEKKPGESGKADEAKKEPAETKAEAEKAAEEKPATEKPVENPEPPK